MRATIRAIGLASLMCVAVIAGWGIDAARPAHAAVQSVTVKVCPAHLSVSVFFDNVQDRPPRLEYVFNNIIRRLTFLDGFEEVDANGKKRTGWAYYARDPDLLSGVQGHILVNGSGAADFEVGQDCPVLGRIAGSAYIDANANGRRDRGEQGFHSAWLKLTDGGSWFVCGWVGSDTTFGITVLPGVYYLMPVAPPGYRTTTPRIKVLMRAYGDVLLNNDIGFVKDPRAPGDACDQYNPPRP
ncbi:MAG: hypothetical protein RMN25_08970 [Anaerolineae bacterium]|nr:hypothetical protein [Thermoflexales bacterium]MDW8407905.1 hypothetical protein [Anaerolineae bacterium]